MQAQVVSDCMPRLAPPGLAWPRLAPSRCCWLFSSLLGAAPEAPCHVRAAAQRRLSPPVGLGRRGGAPFPSSVCAVAGGAAALPFVGPRRARFIYPSHGALSRGVPGCDAPPPPPVGLCRSFRRAPIAAVSARRPSLKAIRCSPSCRRLVRLHLHGGARWLLADARTSLLVDPVLCRCRAV